MRAIRACIVVAVLASALAATGPVVSYFARTREIATNPQLPTNFFALDEEILQYARPDLSDLRIYNGDIQVPYALAAQSVGGRSAEHDAKILNLGAVGGNTEFDLDLSETVQYNHIRLTLDAKDFLVTARVQGKDTLAGARSVDLGVSTLYDFSRESLGSNTTLRLPTASFRYLHVRLTTGIRPQQIKSAVVYSREEKKTYWTNLGSCGAPRQMPTAEPQGSSATAIDCEVPANLPVERIVFTVTDSRVNFQRSVQVAETDTARGKGLLLASDSIRRVQITRGGAVVNDERLFVTVARQGVEHFTVTVANGDDPPLALGKIQPQAIERRVFFEPNGAQHLRLYYGDDKLGVPTYDYAKLFNNDEPAAPAALSPAEANTAFTGRPDDRPWSERHRAMLWAAMLAAVVGLGSLALRGLKQG